MIPSAYNILSVLGTGYSATVYKAVNEDGKIIALKVYNTDVESLNEASVKLLNERSLIGHQYPYLVKINKSAKTYIKGELRNYIEMEYVPGDTLRVLMNDGEESVKVIKRIIPKIQKAIKELKKQGIVYCDLKPENIIITEDGNVKFIDLQHVKIGSQKSVSNNEKSVIEKSIRLPWFLKNNLIYQDELFWKAYNYYYLVELLNDTVVKSNRMNFNMLILFLKMQFILVTNFIEEIDEYSFYLLISGYLLTNLARVFKRRKRFQTFFFDDAAHLAY